MKSVNNKIFYILAGNTTYNRGDRALLYSQVEMLRKKWPEATIVVESFMLNKEKDWFDAVVLKHRFILGVRQIYYLLKADVVIWGGGALMTDNTYRLLIPYWFFIIFFLKFVLHKKIMAWSHGVVIERRWGKVLARLVYGWVDVITVRGENSRQALEEAGVSTNKIVRTADSAITINPKARGVGVEILKEQGVPIGLVDEIVCFVPKYSVFIDKREDWLPFLFKKNMDGRLNKIEGEIGDYNEKCARLCDAIIDERQSHLVLIPHFSRPWPHTDYLIELKERMENKDKVTVVEKDCYRPDDYFAIYRVFDLVVSVAFHDNVISSSVGTPCVNLFYEEKGRELFEMIDARDRMLDWNNLFSERGRDKIIKMVNYTLDNWPRLSKRSDRAIEELKNKARINLLELEKILGQKFYLKKLEK